MTLLRRLLILGSVLLATTPVTVTAFDSFVTMRDGYFYDGSSGKPWVPHGIAYQTWNRPLGVWQTFDQIDYDLDEMKKMGANSIRVDFVWQHIEEAGDNQFSWTNYDYLVQAAESRGIRIFALIGYQWPPGWFPSEWYTMHPPATDSEGIYHANRWQSDIINYEHPQARAQYAEWFQNVCSRYKDSKAIVGWIIGNESGYLGLWSGQLDGYDPWCEQAFRTWCQAKYTNITAVNTAWGSSYANFSNIVFVEQYREYGTQGAEWADMVQWREDSIGSFTAVGARAAKTADTNHLISYSTVGMQWGEEDWRYHAEDRGKITRACEATNAPIDFFSVNNYPWSILGHESQNGQWGISYTKYITRTPGKPEGVPVVYSETGFTSSETMWSGMDEYRQGPLVRNALWESLEAGAIGTHIFSWMDRPYITDREKGFGILTGERYPKASFWVSRDTFTMMKQVQINELLMGSKDPKPDIAFLWTAANDSQYNRYECEMQQIAGAFERLGYEPNFMSLDDLSSGAYTNFKVLVLPRNMRVDAVVPNSTNKPVLRFLREDVLPRGIHILASADLPGLQDQNGRALADATNELQKLFGIDATDVGGYEVVPRTGKYVLENMRRISVSFTNTPGALTNGYSIAPKVWKYNDEVRVTDGKLLATMDTKRNKGFEDASTPVEWSCQGNVEIRDWFPMDGTRHLQMWGESRIAQDSPVVPGGRYTASAYLRSNDSDPLNGFDGYVAIEWYDPSWNLLGTDESEHLTGNTPDNAWVRYAVDACAPENAWTMRRVVRIERARDSALCENGGLSGSASAPTGWNQWNDDAHGASTSRFRSAGNSWRFSDDGGIWHDATSGFSVGDVVRFGGWLRQDSSDPLPASLKHGLIKLEFYNNDTYLSAHETQRITFTNAMDEWIYVEGLITIPANANKVRLVVACGNSGGSGGSFYVDDVFVAKEAPWGSLFVDNLARAPALVVKDHGTAKAAIFLYSAGDIASDGDGDDEMDVLPWRWRYDIFGSIMKGYFGVQPAMKGVGPNAYLCLPEYRTCTNGALLLQVKNYQYDPFEKGGGSPLSFTIQSPLFIGKTIRSFCRGQILESISDGSVDLSLEPDGMDMLYVCTNAPAPLVQIADAPSSVRPTADKSFEVKVNFDCCMQTGALLKCAFREVGDNGDGVTNEIYQVLTNSVSGTGQRIFWLWIPDANTMDSDYISTPDGGRYEIASWLEKGGTNLAEAVPMATQLKWGTRPVSTLPTNITIGSQQTISYEWEDLEEYLSWQTTPLNRNECFPQRVAIFRSSKTESQYPGQFERVNAVANWLETLGYVAGNPLDISFDNVVVSNRFSDDFSDGNYNGWVRAAGCANWAVTNGALRAWRIGNSDNIMVSTNTYTNASVSVDICYNAQDKYFSDAEVYFRYQDRANHYRVGIRNFYGAWRLKYTVMARTNLVAQGWLHEFPKTNAPVENTWYTLRIDVEGVTNKVYFDGQFAGEFAATNFDAGRIAIGSRATQLGIWEPQKGYYFVDDDEYSFYALEGQSQAVGKPLNLDWGYLGTFFATLVMPSTYVMTDIETLNIRTWVTNGTRSLIVTDGGIAMKDENGSDDLGRLDSILGVGSSLRSMSGINRVTVGDPVHYVTLDYAPGTVLAATGSAYAFSTLGCGQGLGAVATISNSAPALICHVLTNNPAAPGKIVCFNYPVDTGGQLTNDSRKLAQRVFEWSRGEAYRARLTLSYGNSAVAGVDGWMLERNGTNTLTLDIPTNGIMTGTNLSWSLTVYPWDSTNWWADHRGFYSSENDGVTFSLSGPGVQIFEGPAVACAGRAAQFRAAYNPDGQLRTARFGLKDKGGIEDQDNFDVGLTGWTPVADSNVTWFVTNGTLRATASDCSESVLLRDGVNVSNVNITLECGMVLTGSVYGAGLVYRGVTLFLAGDYCGWLDDDMTYTNCSTLWTEAWHDIVLNVRSGTPYWVSDVFVDGLPVMLAEPIHVGAFSNDWVGLLSPYSADESMEWDNFRLVDEEYSIGAVTGEVQIATTNFFAWVPDYDPVLPEYQGMRAGVTNEIYFRLAGTSAESRTNVIVCFSPRLMMELPSFPTNLVGAQTYGVPVEWTNLPAAYPPLAYLRIELINTVNGALLGGGTFSLTNSAGSGSFDIKVSGSAIPGAQYMWQAYTYPNYVPDNTTAYDARIGLDDTYRYNSSGQPVEPEVAVIVTDSPGSRLTTQSVAVGYSDLGICTGYVVTTLGGAGCEWEPACSNETPPEGTKCFQTTVSGGGGWGITTTNVGGCDLSGYHNGYLNFSVKTPTDLEVRMVAAGVTGAVWIAAYGWDGSNTWQELSVPVSAFDLSSQRLTRVTTPFAFRSAASTGTFYIANVYFTGPGMAFYRDAGLPPGSDIWTWSSGWSLVLDGDYMGVTPPEGIKCFRSEVTSSSGWVGWGVFATNSAYPRRAVTSVGAAALSVAYQSNYLYVAVMSNGLRVIQAVSPTNMLSVGSLAFTNTSARVRVRNDYACFGGNSPLSIVDIRNPTNPVLVGTTATDYMPVFMFYSNYLFAARTGAVDLISLANPSNPVVLKTVYEATVKDMDVENGTLCVCDGPRGLVTVDVTIPTNPVERGVWTSAGCTYFSVDVTNKIAYVGAGYSLFAVDVSNPQVPSYLGAASGNGAIATVMRYEDGRVYQNAASSTGAWVYAVGNPRALLKLDGWGGDVGLSDFCFDGRTNVYAACANGIVARDTRATGRFDLLPFSRGDLTFWVHATNNLKVESQSLTTKATKYISAYGWNSPIRWQKLRIPIADLAISGMSQGAVLCPFMITDGSSSMYKQFKIDYVKAEMPDLNHPWANTAPQFLYIPNRACTEGETITFAATAVDEDFPTQNVRYALAAGSPATASINATNGVFTWNTCEADPATSTISFYAYDDGVPAMTSTYSIAVVIRETNTIPTLPAISNLTLLADSQCRFYVGGSDPDVPAQMLAYSLSGAPWLALIDISSGLFTWSPYSWQVGTTAAVTVLLRDYGTPPLTNSTTFRISVIAGSNNPPVLGAIGAKSASEGSQLSFTATAYDTNVPAQALTFTLAKGAPANATINSTNGVFSWTPTEAQGPSTNVMTVEVRDVYWAWDKEAITVTVSEVNSAPVLSNVGNRVVSEGSNLSFTMRAVDSDLPAQTVTHSLGLGAPANATINSTNGAFSWTPTELQGGTVWTVTVLAVDSAAPPMTGSQAIVIAVVDVNNFAPVLDPLPNLMAQPGVPVSFTAVAIDGDDPPHTITYSLVPGAPAGAGIDPSAGTFSWTPTTNQIGRHLLTVRAVDSGVPPLTNEESFNITVGNLPVNQREAPAVIYSDAGFRAWYGQMAWGATNSEWQTFFVGQSPPEGSNCFRTTAAGGAGWGAIHTLLSYSVTTLSTVAVSGSGVFVDGDNAYAHTYRGFSVVSLSNVASPTVIGTYDSTNGVGWKYDHANGYIYRACGRDGLQIVDVREPTHPVLAATYMMQGFTGDVYDVAVNGSYAYVNNAYEMEVVDVSVPTNPVLRTSVVFTNGMSTYWSLDNLTVFSNVLIRSCYNYPSELAILYDISNPANPVEASKIEEGYWSYTADWKMSEGRLYQIGWRGLRIWNVENLYTPVLMGSIGSSSWWGGGYYAFDDLYLEGDYAFVNDTYNSIVHVIDVSDPTFPVELGTAPVVGGDTLGMDLLPSNRLCTVSSDGFCVSQFETQARFGSGADLSLYSDADLAFWVKTPMDLNVGVVAAETTNRVRLSQYGWNGSDTWQDIRIPISSFGLSAADLTHVTMPFFAETFPGSNGTFHVDYVRWTGGGLDLYSDAGIASNCALFQFGDTVGAEMNPNYRLDTNSPEGVECFLSTNDSVYSGWYLQSVNKYYPEVGRIAESGSAVVVDGTASNLYVGYTNAFRVYSLTNERTPTAVGYLHTSNAPADMAMAGSYACLAEGSKGIRLVDIASATNPFTVGQITNITADWVAMTTDHVYAGYGSILHVISITNPASPSIVTQWTASACYIERVRYSDNRVYVQNRYGGLWVVDVSDPLQPTTIGSWQITNSFSAYGAGLRVTGTTVYVSQNYSIAILDASDPTNVVTLGTVPHDQYTTSGNDLFVRDGRVYTTLNYSDPKIIAYDIRDLAAPVYEGSWAGAGNRLYVSAMTNAYVPGGTNGVRVLDFSNPHRGEDWSAYAAWSLTFWVRNSSYPLQVSIESVDGTRTVSTSSYGWQNSPYWRKIKIPISAFGLSSNALRHITRPFRINTADTAWYYYYYMPIETGPASFYVDHVRLERGEADSLFRGANRTPQIDLVWDMTAMEGSTLTVPCTALDTDVPAQDLVWGLGGGSPEGASLNPDTGVFTWTPTEEQGPGSYDVTVRVRDSYCSYRERTFNVLVNENNQAPVLNAIGNKSVSEGATVAFTASAADADVPAQVLRFSLDDGAPSGASIDADTGEFSWTPSEAQGPGSYTVTVRVNDDGPGYLDDCETVTVTVTEINLPPVLGAIGNKSGNEGSLITFTATVTDADVPTNQLTFSLLALPSGASIGFASGVFTWTPTEAQGPGSYTVTVQVADSGTPSMSDSEAITITVGDVNQAPVLAPIAPRQATAGQVATFTASATDADIPANTLTYSLGAGAPSGAAIQAASGAFAWTTTVSQVGVYPFPVIVTDNGSPSLATTQTVVITVSPLVLPAETFVSVGGLHVYPYTNWPNAATNVMDAVSAVSSTGTVWVTNGTVVLSASVVVTNPILVRSINGPTNTVLDGNRQYRCFTLMHTGAVVDGFTITRGLGESNRAGGIYNAGQVQNCIIFSNVTSTSSVSTGCGGGVYNVGGRIVNCVIRDNMATASSTNGASWGGGVYLEGGRLQNCTVVGNVAATNAGMAGSGTVVNCIIYGNVAGGAQTNLAVTYSCVTPVFTGTGNITNDPRFASFTIRDLRLTSVSPCLDAGTTNGTPLTDILGILRPLNGDGVGGAGFDMGAYEFASTNLDADGDLLSDYEEAVIFKLDPFDPDMDDDNMLDGEELIAGTNPTNALQNLYATRNASANRNQVNISWNTVVGRFYGVQIGSTPTGPWMDLDGWTDVVGTGDVMTYTATLPQISTIYYRVSVRKP